MALCEGYVIMFFSNIVPSVGERIIYCEGIKINNIENKFLATFFNLEFEVCVPVRMGTCFCTTRIHIDFGYYLQKTW
jgi:hypothetical protein